MAFGNDGVWLALSTGNGFAAPTFAIADLGYNQGWRVANHVRLLADVNRDGRKDIVAFGNDGVWTALSTSTGFAAPRFVLAHFGDNEGWRVAQTPRYVADLNDDGYLDIIGFGNAAVFRSLGGPTGFGEFRMMLRGLVAKKSMPGETVEVGQQFVGDVDGNGMQDLVVFTDQSIAVAVSNTSAPPPPPAGPSNLRTTLKNPSTLYLAWTDNSADERQFLFTYGKSGGIMTTLSLEPNTTVYNSGGYEADTLYCFTVKAENLWGISAETSPFCDRTSPASPTPPTGPQQKTQDISLLRQQGEPFIPYVATFPAGLPIIQGTLKQITNPDIPIQSRSIWIVRLNHSTTQCGDPNAVVPLAPGQSTSPETMAKIYGTSSPALPVAIVACTDNSTPNFPGALYLKITYIEQ